MHGQLIRSLQYWRFWRWHEKRQRKFQVNHIIFTYVFISLSNIQAPHLALVPLPRVWITWWCPTMSITRAFYLSSLSDCSYNVILIRADASDDDMKSVKSASRYFMPVYIMYRYAKSNSVLPVDHVHVLYPKAGRPRLLTVLKMTCECEAFYYLRVLTLIFYLYYQRWHIEWGWY